MTAASMTTVAALRAMAALTWRRARRSRTLWVAIPLAALPVVQGVVLRVVPEYTRLDPGAVWKSLEVPLILLLAVLSPLFAAASLGDEVERNTMTYLWARPVPRWTIAAGKLLALAPLVAVLLVGGAVAAMAVARGIAPPLPAVLALVVGALAVSCAATGIAMLAPRHSIAAPMAYFLFVDLPLGELPMALGKVSMTHHVRELAHGTLGGSGALWLCSVMAVWVAVGLWRLRTFE